MPDLDWLITDKFTINSGGKTPQGRRVESAAKCFSSRMCPSTLHFTPDKMARSPKYSAGHIPTTPKHTNTTSTTNSPLKSIENFLKQSPLTSRHTSYLSKRRHHQEDRMIGDEDTNMEIFQTFCSNTVLNNAWGNQQQSSSSSAQHTDSNDFITKNFPSESCDYLDGCSSGTATLLGGFGSDMESIVPECSGQKMARLERNNENKENFKSILTSSRSSHMMGYDVVRSPTRLDLSYLLSPSRRKAAHCNRKQDERPTPSKFTMVRNSLNKSPASTSPTVDNTTIHNNIPTSSLLLDHNSRDSGLEHSLSFQDKMSITARTEDNIDYTDITRVQLIESTLHIEKFHDESTQSACHFNEEMTQKLSAMEMYEEEEEGDECGGTEGIQSSISNNTNSNNSSCSSSSGSSDMKSNYGNVLSPPAHCSKQSDYVMSPDEVKLTDLEEYEFDTLHDLEDFDGGDIPPGSSMSKYEIISTDSPDITISRGTPSAVSRIIADNFEFGSPIGEQETSKNFGSTSRGVTQKSMGTLYGRIPLSMRSETTRMLNFDTPSPLYKKESVAATLSPSLQDGSVFKLAIEQLTSRGTKREVATYDSGLGGEEDTLLVLDELENHAEAQDHVQPASLHSLIHDTVIHIGSDDEEEGDVVPMESSPLCLPFRRPAFRRCFSLNQSSESNKQDNNNSTLLFDSPKSGISDGFKHPELFQGSITSFLGRKRRKQSAGDLLLTSDGSQDCEMSEHRHMKTSRPTLQRAMSDNEATIKMALTRSLEESELIGDFSSAYRLPVVRSQHSDLKVISPDTLASLLRGEYFSTVKSYQIIDCRYPYEYAGGHIQGAHNLYTEELIHEALIAGQQAQGPGHILVFHCEFSMQRGPKLVRYLRCVDRALHKASYPNLLHPELYLLGGGYCLFSSKHPTHTLPRGSYITMLDPRHVEERRKHQGCKYKGKRT